MTAWTPVSEAAAMLGVSERTIWRRIKSETIDSRSENGRTLVKLDDEDAEFPLQHMSSMAAAQLSLRKLDVDGLNDVLAMVRDYRSTLESEARRARRSARFASLLTLAAAIGLVVGGWYHLREVRRMGDDHAGAMADLRVQHTEAIADLKANAERDSALAADRAERLEHLQELTSEQQSQLAMTEKTQKTFTEKMDTRLSEFARIATADKDALAKREKEMTDLREQITALESSMDRTVESNRRIRDLEHKYTEAVRRSASHSRGMAKGLEIHLSYQKDIERQLRNELAQLRSSNHDGIVSLGSRTVARDDILSSMINQRSGESTRSIPTGESQAHSDDTGWRLIWRHMHEAMDPETESADAEMVLAD